MKLVTGSKPLGSRGSSVPGPASGVTVPVTFPLSLIAPPAVASPFTMPCDAMLIAPWATVSPNTLDLLSSETVPPPLPTSPFTVPPTLTLPSPKMAKSVTSVAEARPCTTASAASAANNAASRV